MQKEFAIRQSCRQLPKTAPKIEESLQQEPNENEHGGNAPFGGIVQIDVMQMAIPSGRKRARNIGRNVAVELEIWFLRPETEPRVGFDHAQPRTPRHHPELVGVDVPGLEDRGKALLHRGWGQENS